MKGDDDEMPVNHGVEEYDARRCHICDRRFPSFGFGPPLRSAGQTLWACLEHRHAVERIVRGSGDGPPRADREPRLL